MTLNTGDIARTGERAEKLGAIAPNTQGGMVRVDVFAKANKKGQPEYYLVPIYIYDFAKKQLPNKAIVAYKPEKDWLAMDDKDFLFSLYKNDLVYVKKKNEEFKGYYTGTDRSTGAISLKHHDSDISVWNNGEKTGIGVKTLLAFEKYSVDYFGNISPKRPPGIREKRLGVAQYHDSESSEAEPVQRPAATG